MDVSNGNLKSRQALWAGLCRTKRVEREFNNTADVIFFQNLHPNLPRIYFRFLSLRARQIMNFFHIPHIQKFKNNPLPIIRDSV
jgi:hypothetical protein